MFKETDSGSRLINNVWNLIRQVLRKNKKSKTRVIKLFLYINQ